MGWWARAAPASLCVLDLHANTTPVHHPPTITLTSTNTTLTTTHRTTLPPRAVSTTIITIRSSSTSPLLLPAAPRPPSQELVSALPTHPPSHSTWKRIHWVVSAVWAAVEDRTLWHHYPPASTTTTRSRLHPPRLQRTACRPARAGSWGRSTIVSERTIQSSRLNPTSTSQMCNKLGSLDGWWPAWTVARVWCRRTTCSLSTRKACPRTSS